MLTQREKMLIIITFCLTFCFAVIVLTYSITAFNHMHYGKTFLIS